MSDVIAEPPAHDPPLPRLDDVSLFAGIAGDDFDDLAAAFRPVEAEAGELLLLQGLPAEGLHVLLSGEAVVCRALPGQRELELARLGPGDVIGEIPLLGGGVRTASVRAVTPCSLLFLRRGDFEARLRARRPGSLELKRRLVAIACGRLRSVHRAVAAAMGDAAGGAPRATTVAWRTAGAELTPALGPPPRASYLARLPMFLGLDPELAVELVSHARRLSAPPRCVVAAAGEQPGCCYVTLNGAVEDVIADGPDALRVGFSGPGGAFGYLGLIDGEPATVASVTRERSVLLAFDARDVRALLGGTDERCRAFAAALERDLVRSLRYAERAKSHLAAAVAS